ncbi:hypothetical protein FOZ61_000557 [Perkinsus olseni]|uniref:Uncharacterized protein n=1 Tax=Perkinsus olseni TaxID=32597 RepID=A0A7J6MG08_PEROL|nr:hypothetical protein FOZ61_000557 [Perkinsus olseni]KAF4675860.1 hypothetical protein FOL46_009651 [Perkinsus olseni]
MLVSRLLLLLPQAFWAAVDDGDFLPDYDCRGWPNGRQPSSVLGIDWDSWRQGIHRMEEDWLDGSLEVLSTIFASEDTFNLASAECPLGTLTAVLIEMGVCFQRDFIDQQRRDAHRAHLVQGCYKDNWNRFLSLVSQFRGSHASLRVFLGTYWPIFPLLNFKSYTDPINSFVGDVDLDCEDPASNYTIDWSHASELGHLEKPPRQAGASPTVSLKFGTHRYSEPDSSGVEPVCFDKHAERIERLLFTHPPHVISASALDRSLLFMQGSLSRFVEAAEHATPRPMGYSKTSLSARFLENNARKWAAFLHTRKPIG